jgi:hypothetical protein
MNSRFQAGADMVDAAMQANAFTVSTKLDSLINGGFLKRL